VSNLTSKSLALEQVICLTWDAPPTLDITRVDPDISYCVDIRAVTINTDSFPLITICNVYIPEFNFTMEYPNTSTSVIYEFQVTPRNGAGEGPTSTPVYGFFSGRELLMTMAVLFVYLSDFYTHLSRPLMSFLETMITYELFVATLPSLQVVTIVTMSNILIDIPRCLPLLP